MQSNTKTSTDTKNNTKELPLWKVILLNDNINQAVVVVDHVYSLTPLKKEEAILKMVEAHKTGRALLLTCFFERAELYKEQFASLIPPIGIELEPC
jgi:ATP-dependent Clp protease adaptor protein ClpS